MSTEQNGPALGLPADALKRFWENVEKTDTCWNWTGRMHKEGYGRFSYKASDYYAHRVSLSQKTPLIPGLTIDHLCRNRKCVNPDHLEQVTNGENVSRAQRGRLTCIRGHAYTPENIRIAWNGSRACKACDRLRWHERKNKTKSQ